MSRRASKIRHTFNKYSTEDASLLRHPMHTGIYVFTVTAEFAVDLGSSLRWGQPTVP
jgi:hypothetical protein